MLYIRVSEEGFKRKSKEDYLVIRKYFWSREKNKWKRIYTYIIKNSDIELIVILIKENNNSVSLKRVNKLT